MLASSVMFAAELELSLNTNFLKLSFRIPLHKNSMNNRCYRVIIIWEKNYISHNEKFFNAIDFCMYLQ